ncbi:conserved hypothetical protein [Coccidioides posadasii str. Silveira]|uniref:Uncharacterized protein n=1 Tax=Coccidioides posadasii (strain RMSCC 757 / Silveira) TaxID=443226 RepID=E9DJL1_COCPS|nr:conserved hypothetical protein [Coccidioides posadasii str. Silveira]
MSSIDFRKVVWKTASSAKTKESESKFNVKSSESTNIEAAIEKMTNEFINLATALVNKKELELEKLQHISHAFTVENLNTINFSIMNTNMM